LWYLEEIMPKKEKDEDVLFQVISDCRKKNVTDAQIKEMIKKFIHDTNNISLEKQPLTALLIQVMNASDSLNFLQQLSINRLKRFKKSIKNKGRISKEISKEYDKMIEETLSSLCNGTDPVRCINKKYGEIIFNINYGFGEKLIQGN